MAATEWAADPNIVQTTPTPRRESWRGSCFGRGVVHGAVGEHVRN